MPAPKNVLTIAPLAKVADCTTVLGVTPTSDIFTEADAPIRTATHKLTNGSVSPAQLAVVEAHIISPHADLAGVTCVVWTRGGANPISSTLEGLGLTPQDGSELARIAE